MTAPASALAPASPLRVLFIEDSEIDFKFVVRLLRQAGFDVTAERVEDGNAMRQALRSAAWDAVISDHKLPGFSAVQALEVFKSAALDVPFLIVSGEIGEDLAVEAMLAGADDYIQKSRLARLVPALERSLRSSAARQQRRHAEEALRASEARLRSIAENVPGIVFRIIHDTLRGGLRFDYVSDGAAKLFGVPAEELQRDSDPFGELLRPEVRASLLRAFSESAAARREVRWQGDLRAAPRWIQIASTPRATSEAHVLHWEGVAVDITGQKQAEAALIRSREQLRLLSAHLAKTKERERQAIAREIHDDIGGILTSLKFELAGLAEELPPEWRASPRLASMARLLEATQQAASRIMHDLRPGVLNLGVVPALDWLARDFEKRHGIRCRFATNRETVELSEERRTAVFRVCQEALTNIVKHASARHVEVELFLRGDAVTLEIRDDGEGLPSRSLEGRGRFGLIGMRERAAALGGWVEVSSAPGRGTTVMMSLPVQDIP
jgi:PAS domain S-box-containing protein